RIRVVVIVVVMRDRQDIRAFRGTSDPLPQLLLAVLLRWMRTKVVPVGTEAHARVDEDGHVRRLDECRHRQRSVAFIGYGHDFHWLLISLPLYCVNLEYVCCEYMVR